MSLTIFRPLESFRADFQIPWVFSPTGWCVTLDSNQQTIACTLMISAIMQTRLPRTLLTMFFSPATHINLAEGVGFEPTWHFMCQAAFEAAPLQPLRYPSGYIILFQSSVFVQNYPQSLWPLAICGKKRQPLIMIVEDHATS